MTKPLCIYHGHCDDGFAAAWAVRHAVGPDLFEFYPGVYQQEPPDVRGRNVLFVDFSYKRPVLQRVAQAARSVLILDHHKTAQEDLADGEGFVDIGKWSSPLSWERHLQNVYQDECEGAYAVTYTLFDMERSGAGLTWDFFHVGQPRPDFIDYVEDRDLWRKQLPGGDEFTIALRSYPQEFKVWDELVAGGALKLINQGSSIQRYYRLRVEELKRSAYQASIADAPFWVANAPYFAASEVAGELAEREHGFGACYFEVSQGRWQYSLRARGDFDVSEIAKQFGGGGHKGAAGFTVGAPIHTPLGSV